VLAALTREQFHALPRGATAEPRAATPAAPATAATAAASAAPAAAESSMAAPAGAPTGAVPAVGHAGVTVERTADGEEIIRVPVIEEQRSSSGGRW
jgi:hypothetical protein